MPLHTSPAKLKILSAFFACFVFFPACSWAASESVPSYAQLAFPYQNQGDSSRAIALGSAYVAVDGDEASLFWNPAGLATLPCAQLAFHHNFWLQDLMVDTIAFATSQDSFGTWGLYASYGSFGNLQGRDSNGTATGNYNAGSWAGEVEWAHSLFFGLSIGLGLKGNLMNLSGSDYSNVAGDVGVLWAPDPALHFGASFSNWGTDVATYVADSIIRAGGTCTAHWSSDNQTLFAASFNAEPYGVAQLNFGAEDLLASFLALRAGYICNFTNNEVQGLTGATAGLGFHFQDIVLDYAYAPMGDLGTSQRLSLTYLFRDDTPVKTSSSVITAKPTPAMTPIATPTPVMGLNNATPVVPTDKLKLLFSLSQGPETPTITPDPQWEAKVQAEKDAIAQDAQDAQAWYRLGTLYYQAGQKEDAVQCYEQVLRLKPENQKLRDWLSQYKIQGN